MLVTRFSTGLACSDSCLGAVFGWFGVDDIGSPALTCGPSANDGLAKIACSAYRNKADQVAAATHMMEDYLK
jgi:hypothetical protein